MTDPKLTGRTRCRIQKRFLRHPLLVLEVQEQGMRIDYCGGHTDVSTVTYWRDATVEDLWELTPKVELP